MQTLVLLVPALFIAAVVLRGLWSLHVMWRDAPVVPHSPPPTPHEPPPAPDRNLMAPTPLAVRYRRHQAILTSAAVLPYAGFSVHSATEMIPAVSRSAAMERPTRLAA